MIREAIGPLKPRTDQDLRGMTPCREGVFSPESGQLAAKVAVGFARRDRSPLPSIGFVPSLPTTGEPRIVGFVRSASHPQDWLRSVQWTSWTPLGFGRRVRVKDAAGEIGFVWSSRWRRVGPIGVVGFVWSISAPPRLRWVRSVNPPSDRSTRIVGRAHWLRLVNLPPTRIGFGRRDRDSTRHWVRSAHIGDVPPSSTAASWRE